MRRSFILLTLFVFAAAFLLSEWRATAGEVGPASTARMDETNAQDAWRGVLQLQEQLHATQLAIEQIRKENNDAAATNLVVLANKLQTIENALAAQHGSELTALQSSNQTMVMTSAILAVIGLAALLLMAVFQWRTVHRLAEISVGMPGFRPLTALPPGPDHLVLSGPAEQSSNRLLGALEKLEQRIGQLEHTVPALELPGGNGHGNGDRRPSTEPNGVPSLLAKGQSLLDANQAPEALSCFDEALKLAPGNTEALVKKGTALEKLARLDEAIQCYDQAIAADDSMTIAYLYKGGLFNRMERFAEALACYEQALRTQEKRAV